MTWITATQSTGDKTPVTIWVNLARVQWMRRGAESPEAYTLLNFGDGPGLSVSETPEELLRRGQVLPLEAVRSNTQAAYGALQREE